ncbi:hypothetical protein KY316_03235, partial [Candidatus Woesearchaeota archaeon]|nr:hypothetical protein [Candidatus Woesearchaeota archaeon]
TRREEIFELLKKGRMSAQDIANMFGCILSDIEEDLMHLAKSVRPRYELRMFPAQCKDCGFVYKERSKVKKPSKCPRCRSESISPPLFKIEEKVYKKSKRIKKPEENQP